MSDAKVLKDCLIEYRKANKALDDKLSQIENDNRQRLQEVEGQSSRQD